MTTIVIYLIGLGTPNIICFEVKVNSGCLRQSSKTCKMGSEYGNPNYDDVHRAT